MSEKIITALFAAVRMLNEMRPAEEQIPEAPATILLGEGANLDSMDVVNLLLAAEDEMRARGIEPPSLIELAGALTDETSGVTVELLAARISESLDHNG